MVCLISLKDIHVLVNSFIPLSMLAPPLVATNNSQPQVVFINILIAIPFKKRIPLPILSIAKVKDF